MGKCISTLAMNSLCSKHQMMNMILGAWANASALVPQCSCADSSPLMLFHLAVWILTEELIWVCSCFCCRNPHHRHHQPDHQLMPPQILPLQGADVKFQHTKLVYLVNPAVWQQQLLKAERMQSCEGLAGRHSRSECTNWRLQFSGMCCNAIDCETPSVCT